MNENEDTSPPFKRARVIKTEQISEDDYTEDIYNTEEGIENLSMNNSYVEDQVNPEELEKLREFQVLDEVRSNEDDSNDANSISSDDKSDDLPDDAEIERMLEEGLPEGFKGAPKPKERPYFTRQKIVLEEKGINHFEVLPLDWMMVRHYSGMPVYLHKSTRVCTLAKPYFLGKGSARRHDVPLSAIPCLSYRRALREEENQKEIDKRIAEQIKNGHWKAPNVNSNTAPTNVSDNTPQDLSKINDLVNGDANENGVQNENGKINSEKLVRKCPFGKNKNLSNNDEQNDVNHIRVNDKEGMVVDTEQNHVDCEPHGDIIYDAVNDTTEQNGECSDLSDIPVSRRPVVLPGGIVMPPPRVETVNKNWKTQHLTYEQVNEYCKTLFNFKTVNIMHFKRWADRRKYAKARKTLQYPALPGGTKLITIPAGGGAGEGGAAGGGGAAGAGGGGGAGGGKAAKRDWVMNMNGCSYLSVFHEYVRRALQKQPVYHFQQLENASSPYQATVFIGGMQYGVGRGSSKRQAKAAAAKASIHILIPEMKEEGPSVLGDHEPDFSFFDCVGIEDPRITEFCAATCEPSPHAILRTCLLRNFGAGDRHIHTEMKKLECQKIELTMKVGKHTATVLCKNKKTAKQRASQSILQALHPHVRSWGSLLRLYGSRSVKTCKEKKLEEQQITLLQEHAARDRPNRAVLAKLREEMGRLRDRDAALAPVGTLLLARDHRLPSHSASGLDSVRL